MRLFQNSQVTIIRNNDGKAFRKMLKLDKRPIHILTGKSEIRKYSRVAHGYISREHLFIFELPSWQIAQIVEEYILSKEMEDLLYVVEVTRFDEEVHQMLDEIASMYKVSIAVRVG